MEIREIDGLFHANESYKSCQGKRTLQNLEYGCFFFKLVVEDIFVSSIVTLDLSMEIRSPTYQQEEGIGGP